LYGYWSRRRKENFSLNIHLNLRLYKDDFLKEHLNTAVFAISPQKALAYGQMFI